MGALIQDVRFAVRQLMRAPTFALVAVATLALAIGASTAVFSVLDATVVRPLPYNQPEQIVRLQTYAPEGYGQPASWMQYLDWKRDNTTLTALAGYEAESANLESPTGAAPVRAVYGTDNFFNVFAVKPLMGRTFAQGEDQVGHNDVVVLSYELWQQSFAGRKDVVGSSLKLDGVVNTVIGVMPAGFRYPLSVTGALYRPFHLPQTRTTNRGQHFLPTIGRMKQGVTIQQAQSDMQHLFDNLGRTYPDEAGRRVKMLSLTEATLGKTAGPLRVLTLAVFGVLLVGCCECGWSSAFARRTTAERVRAAGCGGGRTREAGASTAHRVCVALTGGSRRRGPAGGGAAAGNAAAADWIAGTRGGRATESNCAGCDHCDCAGNGAVRGLAACGSVGADCAFRCVAVKWERGHEPGAEPASRRIDFGTDCGGAWTAGVLGTADEESSGDAQRRPGVLR